MAAHEAMVPNEAILTTTEKASSGIKKFSTTPKSPTTPVSRIPATGTPDLETLVANWGAEPATPMECRMRPVEYRPAFSEEAAAVITTSCIIGAVPATPILSKKVTKGDSVSL